MKHDINYNIYFKTQLIQILSFQHVAPAMIQVFNTHMWPVATVLDSTDLNPHVLFPTIGLFPSLPTLTWNTDPFPDSPKQS